MDGGMWGTLPGVALLCGAAVLLVSGQAWWILRSLRRSPDKERKRRENVNRFGRMGDAVITDVRDDSLYYTYEVRGVGYTASQDISGLREYLPAALERLIGHAGIKYDQRNPANSIMVREEWSGVRVTPGALPSEQAGSLGFRGQGDST